MYSSGHYQAIRPKLSQDGGAESLPVSEASTVAESFPIGETSTVVQSLLTSEASTVAEGLTGSETPTLASTQDFLPTEASTARKRQRSPSDGGGLPVLKLRRTAVGWSSSEESADSLPPAKRKSKRKRV